MLEKPELKVYQIRSIPTTDFYTEYKLFSSTFRDTYGPKPHEQQDRPQAHSLRSGKFTHQVLARNQTEARAVAPFVGEIIETNEVPESEADPDICDYIRQYQSIDYPDQLTQEFIEGLWNTHTSIEDSANESLSEHMKHWENLGGWFSAGLLWAGIIISCIGLAVFEQLLIFIFGLGLALGSFEYGAYARWNQYKYSGDFKLMIDPWSSRKRFASVAFARLMSELHKDVVRQMKQDK